MSSIQSAMPLLQAGGGGSRYCSVSSFYFRFLFRSIESNRSFYGLFDIDCRDWLQQMILQIATNDIAIVFYECKLNNLKSKSTCYKLTVNFLINFIKSPTVTPIKTCAYPILLCQSNQNHHLIGIFPFLLVISWNLVKWIEAII